MIQGDLQCSVSLEIGKLLLKEAPFWMNLRSSNLLEKVLGNICNFNDSNNSNNISYILNNTFALQVFMEAIHLGCCFNFLNTMFIDREMSANLFEVSASILFFRGFVT